MKIYALKCKNRMDFLLWARTIEELESEILQSYSNWKSCTPKDKVELVTIDDFLKNKERVKVLISKI